MLTCPSMGRRWWLPPGGRTVPMSRECSGEVAGRMEVAGRRYQATLHRADMGKVLCTVAAHYSTLHKTIKYTQNTKQTNTKHNMKITQGNTTQHNLNSHTKKIDTEPEA